MNLDMDFIESTKQLRTLHPNGPQITLEKMCIIGISHCFGILFKLLLNICLWQATADYC